MDLKPFCGREGHYKISEPWNYKGFTYATDGIIAVRIIAQSPDTVSDIGFPNAWKLFEDALKQQIVFKPWNHETLTPCNLECLVCSDTVWDENGDVEKEVYNPKCKFCHGAGKYDSWKPILIDGVPWTGHYVALLDTLPQVEYFIPKPKGWPMVFKFAEGIGLLMPKKTL